MDPFRDRRSAGRVVEYQGVGRDITDQKRAEHALRTAEQRNSAILRAIPDMMFVLRRDGTYVDYHARDPSGDLRTSRAVSWPNGTRHLFALISPRQ